MIKKLEKLYEGKAKILYSTDDPKYIIQYFKDEATAFNAMKKGIIESKGIINNAISSTIFDFLEQNGIPTHFVRRLSDREMLTRRLEIIPVEVVIRNLTAGSLAKRMGMEEGLELDMSVLEFYYKSDPLGDPMINEYHIEAFKLASKSEIEIMKKLAFKVNDLLRDYFDKRGIILVDFKLEFGRSGEDVFLADEITPDGCRLWDKVTRERMDKDRFRRELGRVKEAYQEVYEKVCERVMESEGR